MVCNYREHIVLPSNQHSSQVLRDKSTWFLFYVPFCVVFCQEYVPSSRDARDCHVFEKVLFPSTIQKECNRLTTRHKAVTIQVLEIKNYYHLYDLTKKDFFFFHLE